MDPPKNLLSGRPGEFPAPKKVYMYMKHLLSGILITVYHQPIPAFVDIFLYGDSLNSAENPPHKTHVFIVQVLHPFNMSPWDNNDMDGGLWTDICESHYEFVLIYKISLNFTARYLTKNTIHIDIMIQKIRLKVYTYYKIYAFVRA